MAEAVLVAQQVSRQYPGVLALDRVDFELRPGEVHALVGENGAGKSTLVKILSGQLQPTGGRLLLNGQPTTFDTPMHAQAAGISVINQEFSLVPQQSVAENIFIGREPRRALGLIDWKAMNERSAAVLRELGLDTAPTQRVEYLSVADRQLVEIAKSLAAEYRVIIMDEPTAALNASEVERLFQIMTSLRQRGVALLYVSHRLNEIFRMADRVTVLRDGRNVGTHAIAAVTEQQVITMMLGRELEEYSADHTDARQAEVPALSVRTSRRPAPLPGSRSISTTAKCLAVRGSLARAVPNWRAPSLGCTPCARGQSQSTASRSA
jgi:ABC-type sugar transport system ATPase subunit